MRAHVYTNSFTLFRKNTHFVLFVLSPFYFFMLICVYIIYSDIYLCFDVLRKVCVP